MQSEPCQPGKHRNPSPSHEIGAWCNDCGQFVRLVHFEPKPETYLIDGRNEITRIEPNLETPDRPPKPCGCGWYRQPDGSLLHWYCTVEHMLDD